MKLKLGIDIGGTKINIGLLDETGRVVAKRKISVPSGMACPAILEHTAQTVRSMLYALDANLEDVLQCGMGVPGTVSDDGRIALKVPNLGWTNEPCAAVFEELTGIRTALVQDSRAAALGEYKMGAGQGRKLVVCITLGTGIGMGIVMDGRIFHGALGCAGELGHLLARPAGRPCGCGRRGCVETYSAGKGLAVSAAQLFGDAAGTHGAEGLFHAAATGNARALAILEEATEILGTALCSVINILSPDALIFSGGMSAQKELYVDPLISFVRDHAYSLSVDDRLLIDTAILGEDAPMIGAALLLG